MPGTTITISGPQRNGLYELVRNHLGSVGDLWDALERDKDFATAARLGLEFGEDFELLEDIGWASEADQESVGLTMPREKLAETLKRLRRDARRAPFSVRHEREPEESVDECWRRFRQAWEVCEELLCRLDSSGQDEEDPEPISGVSPEDVARYELGPYTSVTDGFVLAALERAELHEQEAEVLTSALMGHLGFKWAPSTNRLFFPRLEELRQAGLLTSIERRGEPYWSLTSVGREQLAKEREAGEVGDLPESPQHRAWRHAREQAAVRIDGFRGEQTEALEAADELLNRYKPSLSQEWLDLSERLHWSTWHMASAIHCLHEWVEPDDEVPDVEGLAQGQGDGMLRPGTPSLAKSKEATHERETASKKGAGKSTKAPSAGKKDRLGPGELDKLVLAYMRKHKKDAPQTPSAIAKGIERSSGAVANCLARLEGQKKVRLVKPKPREYELVETKGKR